MCDLSHNRLWQLVLGSEIEFGQRNDVSPVVEFLTCHWKVKTGLDPAFAIEPFIKGIFVHFTE